MKYDNGRLPPNRIDMILSRIVIQFNNSCSIFTACKAAYISCEVVVIPYGDCINSLSVSDFLYPPVLGKGNILFSYEKLFYLINWMNYKIIIIIIIIRSLYIRNKTYYQAFNTFTSVIYIMYIISILHFLRINYLQG